MRTYLLEAERPEDLAILRHVVWQIRRKWRRAVLVTRDEDIAPPFGLVRRSMGGDQMAEQCKRWLTKSILDDLHDEYVRSCPIDPRTVRGAEQRFINARRAQKRARKALADAIEAEKQAARDLVRTHGKAPIVLDGKTYYPSYTEDSLSNSQLQGNAGNYVRWAPVYKKGDAK